MWDDRATSSRYRRAIGGDLTAQTQRRRCQKYIIDMLSSGSSMQQLCIRDQFLGAHPSANTSLAIALASNTSVEWIALDGAEEGACLAVLMALKFNQCVKSLHILVESDDVGIALGDSIKANTSLLTLHVDMHVFSDEGTLAVAEALRQNTSLTHITMVADLLGDGCGLGFAKALLTNNTLTSVEVQGDLWSNISGVAFADALKANMTLQSLYVEAGRWCDRTGDELAFAISTNSTLNHLDIFGGGFTDVTGIALGNALKTNTSLESLILAGHRLSTKTTAAFAEALSISNVSLQHLAISDLRLPLVLEEALYRNQELPSVWKRILLVAKNFSSLCLHMLDESTVYGICLAIFANFLPPRASFNSKHPMQPSNRMKISTEFVLQWEEHSIPNDSVVKLSPTLVTSLAEHAWASWIERLPQIQTHDLGTRAVLLTFTRNPYEFTRALRHTEAAKRLFAASVSIRPAWAHGATVLAFDIEEAWRHANLGIELRQRHVIAETRDIESIMYKLRERCKITPTLAKSPTPIPDPGYETVEDDCEDERRSEPESLDVSELIVSNSPNYSSTITSNGNNTSTDSNNKRSGKGYLEELRRSWIGAVRQTMTETRRVHLDIRNTFVDERPAPDFSPVSQYAETTFEGLSVNGFGNPRAYG